jgi:thiol-disulfide isomerase/thioredoxin
MKHKIVFPATGFAALITLVIAQGSAQEPAAKDRSPFEILKAEYEEATAAWQAKYSGDRTTPSEQLIARYNAWPAWSLMPRIVKLGTADAEAPQSFEALKWFVELSRGTGASDKEYYAYDKQVMDALRAKHLANPRIVEVFRECSYYVTPAHESLLREGLEKGGTREVRGQACYYLAECLRNKGMLPSNVFTAEVAAADAFQMHLRSRRSPDYLAFARSIDASKALEEAKTFDQRVIDEFGDVPHPGGLPYSLFTRGKPTLGFVTRFRQAQRNAITVGQPAPEITGEDLDGKERKLSDYKGKVVVLHFWATWCPPCVEKMPHLMTLAAQHEKEPLAMLGVNYDFDRAVAMKFVEDKRVSWPSLWSVGLGESMGRWFIEGQAGPDVMVIDHTGVLRHYGVDGDELDKAVESLLKERAEKAPGGK